MERFWFIYLFSMHYLLLLWMQFSNILCSSKNNCTSKHGKGVRIPKKTFLFILSGMLNNRNMVLYSNLLVLFRRVATFRQLLEPEGRLYRHFNCKWENMLNTGHSLCRVYLLVDSFHLLVYRDSPQTWKQIWLSQENL